MAEPVAGPVPTRAGPANRCSRPGVGRPARARLSCGRAGLASRSRTTTAKAPPSAFVAADGAGSRSTAGACGLGRGHRPRPAVHCTTRPGARLIVGANLIEPLREDWPAPAVSHRREPEIRRGLRAVARLARAPAAASCTTAPPTSTTRSRGPGCTASAAGSSAFVGYKRTRSAARRSGRCNAVHQPPPTPDDPRLGASTAAVTGGNRWPTAEAVDIVL